MNPYRTDSPAVHAHNHLELTLALIGSHRDPNLKVTVLGVTLIWSKSAYLRTDPNPNLNSLLSKFETNPILSVKDRIDAALC